MVSLTLNSLQICGVFLWEFFHLLLYQFYACRFCSCISHSIAWRDYSIIYFNYILFYVFIFANNYFVSNYRSACVCVSVTFWYSIGFWRKICAKFLRYLCVEFGNYLYTLELTLIYWTFLYVSSAVPFPFDCK